VEGTVKADRAWYRGEIVREYASYTKAL